MHVCAHARARARVCTSMMAGRIGWWLGMYCFVISVSNYSPLCFNTNTSALSSANIHSHTHCTHRHSNNNETRISNGSNK